MELQLKKCSSCQESLPLDSFGPRLNKLQSQCRPCTRISKKLFMNKNRDDVNAKMREYRQRLKDNVYQAYGGYLCVCCGESRKVFLCLDHINNDGYEQRKLLRSTIQMHLWLKNNNFPLGLQVLCYNCNNAKRFGVCPHQQEELNDRSIT